ncbi:GNAT family N-acetyltransferase [Pseudoalteromonas phenolica]|uniref:GNAT family N-acetyltransferase n=1 Tax=Pseudoalteromonas phenolica TaxID=161398 RepID=A0A4Q7IQA4_9GAMM|nr:GNAT family N-acetyltransferase [Pseudoalteromonas phenolica]RZQ54494.1 GNAT family N-acetyltransferase [Pseudoalteromonas phenolica]
MEFTTKRLIIRLLKVSDLEAVLAHRSDPFTSRFIGKPATLADAQARIAQAQLPWKGKEGERLILAIECKESGLLLGELMFKFVSVEHQCGEIGYRLAGKYQGKGYAFEAANALIKEVFTQFKLNKLNAICAVDNIASWKLMEKLGMKREGRLRNNLMLPSGTTDCFTYGVLKHEVI